MFELGRRLDPQHDGGSQAGPAHVAASTARATEPPLALANEAHAAALAGLTATELASTSLIAGLKATGLASMSIIAGLPVIELAVPALDACQHEALSAAL